MCDKRLGNHLFFPQKKAPLPGSFQCALYLRPLGKERLPSFDEDVGFCVVSPQLRTLTHLFEGVTVCFNYIFSEDGIPPFNKHSAAICSLYS